MLAGRWPDLRRTDYRRHRPRASDASSSGRSAGWPGSSPIKCAETVTRHRQDDLLVYTASWSHASALRARVEGFAGRRAPVLLLGGGLLGHLRAVKAAGIGSSLRCSAKDEEARRMRPAGSRRRCSPPTGDAGIRPIAVVANSGTTLTGAVDPIDRLADVYRRGRPASAARRACRLPAAAAPRPAGCSRGSRRRRLRSPSTAHK